MSSLKKGVMIFLYWGILVNLHLFFLSGCVLDPSPRVEIAGQVVDAESSSPFANALVFLRSTDIQTYTDQEGHFRLLVPKNNDEIEITAWAMGYYVASGTVSLPSEDLMLTLRKHHQQDHTEYVWIDPTPSTTENACGNCHPMILPQWEQNAHGLAISNPRFFSFYNGTDTQGHSIDQSGYVKDFPGTSGNCANCHAPGIAVDQPFTANMTSVRDQITSGIHCDFCHKVGGVYLDPANKQVYPNTAGVLSMRMLRPPEGDQIFIGPYPDIHDPDTYHPVFSQSDFCAPCHQFSFWGTQIYNSYGEWLASDYAVQGITCQDCHMAPNGDQYFALPETGGLSHPPETIPSHQQLGIKDIAFMKSTLDLAVSHEVTNGVLDLTVSLTNIAAGHHVPTDHPGRHIILVVQAFDPHGNSIPSTQGAQIPSWAGDFYGETGVVYAKVLEDAKTGDYPVVNYWKQTLIHSDNRIAANERRDEHFSFRIGESQTTIEIQVIFRRLFQPQAELYGWDMTEITLAEETITVRP